ncbi:MAG: hypothetical protein AAB966_01915, partial [Patescibacteria group bacterium]
IVMLKTISATFDLHGRSVMFKKADVEVSKAVRKLSSADVSLPKEEINKAIRTVYDTIDKNDLNIYMEQGVKQAGTPQSDLKSPEDGMRNEIEIPRLEIPRNENNRDEMTRDEKIAESQKSLNLVQ